MLARRKLAGFEFNRRPPKEVSVFLDKRRLG
jgi:hypothetical protein